MEVSTEENLEKIARNTYQVGMELVEARRQFERMELLKLSYRAKIMNKYDDGELSETKIRRLAEMDPKYIAYLEKLAEYKSQSERLRMKYESLKNLFEAKRSMMSYQKAEMRFL